MVSLKHQNLGIVLNYGNYDVHLYQMCYLIGES